MTKKNVLYVILIITSYNLSALYFIDYRDTEFVIKTLFWIGIGTASGFFDPLIMNFKNSFRVLDTNSKKKFVQTFGLWVLTIFLLKKIGWMPKIINESVTILIAYIPAYWLLRLKYASLTIVTMIFLLLSTLYLLGKYEQTSTLFINSTYLWIALSLFFGIKEVYSKPTEHER